jgi:cytoskeleton protein RodZ
MAVGSGNADDETPEGHRIIFNAQDTPRRPSVSTTLRDRREECGLDIRHVAQTLRIRPAVLIAIEDGKFDQLPGPAYAVGFVRSYSAYLGLDAEALVLRFKAEASEMASKPDLNFPLPLGDRRVPTGPILIICVLLAVLTYGGWYYYFGGRDQMTAFVPGVPERLHNLLAPQPPPAPVSGPVTAQPAMPASPAETAPTTAAVAPVAAAAESDGTPPIENRPDTALVVPNPPALPDIAAPKPVEPEKAPAEGSYGSTDNDSRVVLHATADSWVEVRDSHSNLLFSRVLKPGERYNAPNEPGLTLIAGNAGGLNITVDGTNIPAIGELGHVARNVSLDPDRLLGAHAHAN